MTVKAGRAIKRKHDILSHVIGALLVSHPTDINWACKLHFTWLPGLPHEEKGKKRKYFTPGGILAEQNTLSPAQSRPWPVAAVKSKSG